jgi:hypothetical protein
MSSPPSGYSRLMGIAAVIASVATLMGAIYANNKPSNSSTFSPSTSPSTSPSPSVSPSVSTPPSSLTSPSTEPDQAEIESAIKTSYVTYHTALETLSTEGLEASYTGEALKAKEQYVKSNSNARSSSGEKLAFINIDYDFNETKFENYQVVSDEKVKVRATTKIN